MYACTCSLYAHITAVLVHHMNVTIALYSSKYVSTPNAHVLIITCSYQHYVLPVKL